MKHFRWSIRWVLAFVLAGALGTIAGDQAKAATIRGQLLYPDGRPAPGVSIGLYPHSGEDLDLENVYWKIPNYDFHKTVTDENGQFVMSNVIDYPENRIHRYVLFVDKPKLYHSSQHVVLNSQKTELEFRITLKKATVLRLKLRDRDGRPFTGRRAIYVQSGVLGQGVMKGISYVTQVDFVNGVGEWGPVVIKDRAGFQGRVAILDFPSAQFARAAMRERGIQDGDTDEPLRWVSRNSRRQALDHSVRFNPGDYTDLEFSLE